jgi:hypothetical protein
MGKFVKSGGDRTIYGYLVSARKTSELVDSRRGAELESRRSTIDTAQTTPHGPMRAACTADNLQRAKSNARHIRCDVQSGLITSHNTLKYAPN